MLKITPKEITAGSVEEDMQGVNTYNWVMVQIRIDTITVVKQQNILAGSQVTGQWNEEEEERDQVADLNSGSEDRK